jgi:hypothetical protein
MEILGLIALVAFCGITLLASLEATMLLFPLPVERARKNLENFLGRSLLLGLVNFIFVATIVILFAWLSDKLGNVLGGILAVIVLVILVGFVLLVILGLSALSSLVGGRMGEAKSPVVALRRGGLLLILSGLAPYVGWFVFTPLILWASFGASIQSMLRRKNNPLPEET